jgi:hypothetical protein
MMSEEKTKKSFWCTGLTKKKGGLVMAGGFAGMLILFAVLALQELR